MWLAQNRELLERFRRGEPEAMAAVFRHYVNDVVITLRAGVVVGAPHERVRVGTHLPEADIEALVQETFARAFAEKARNSYDGLRPFGAWLGTIARNLVVDRARHLQRDRLLRDKLESGEGAAEPAVDPGTAVDAAAMDRIVAEVEAALPADERAVFRARYRQEQSLRECAASLSIGIIRVRRMDNKIRAQLLDRLRAAGYLQEAQVTIPTSLLPRRKTQGEG